MPLLSEIEHSALKLPPNERAQLAEHLIQSLDQYEETQIDQLWVAEANKRYEEYKAGRISSRPSSDVFKDALKRFS